MTSRRLALIALVALVSVALAACGGGSSPAGPGPDAGVTLVGNVVGTFGAASVGASSGSSAAAATLTVFVQENPAITTTVGSDGSFTLRGLPPGGFTLVFQEGGVTIGTLSFSQVNANQEITITVMVSGGSVVLVEQRRNGIGHGELEIEGLVEQVLVLDPAGESRFVIDGYVVAARPGQTAIREGNRARSVNEVAVGRRVHVKGVWLPAEGGVQPVLAHEIKLQGASSGPGGDPGPSSFCPDAGRKAEVEGKITAKGAADITVFQTGKGDFLAQVDAGTRIRKGNKTYTFEQLAVGNRVHVKGTSLGLSGETCGVDASEIKLQN
jgi:hypothetical protein